MHGEDGKAEKKVEQIFIDEIDAFNRLEQAQKALANLERDFNDVPTGETKEAVGLKLRGAQQEEREAREACEAIREAMEPIRGNAVASHLKAERVAPIPAQIDKAAGVAAKYRGFIQHTQEEDERDIQSLVETLPKHYVVNLLSDRVFRLRNLLRDFPELKEAPSAGDRNDPKLLKVHAQYRKVVYYDREIRNLTEAVARLDAIRQESEPNMEAQAVAPAVSASDLKDRVTKFLKECCSYAQTKVFKKHIWLSWGHSSPRQFQYCMSQNPKATKKNRDALQDLLRNGPKAFVDDLRKRKLLN